MGSGGSGVRWSRAGGLSGGEDTINLECHLRNLFSKRKYVPSSLTNQTWEN